MGNWLSKVFPPRKDGTAQGVAKYRYMELLQPDASKRLFVDPYSFAYVIGSPIIKVIGYEYCHSQSDVMVGGMWESLICRQIFIDDEIRKGVEGGDDDGGKEQGAGKGISTKEGKGKGSALSPFSRLRKKNQNIPTTITTVSSSLGSATQIVILGAGYDNRFYRLSCLNRSDMTLIEVDQPEVQELKKKGLKSMGIIKKLSEGEGGGDSEGSLKEDDVESFKFISPTIDESIIESGKSCKIDFKTTSADADADTKGSYSNTVHFCPCNFETMDLKEQILKTPFDSTKQTIFVMEGLTQYVDKGALEETIHTINDICGAPGSKIIITYVDSRLYDDNKVGEICNGTQMKKILAMLEQKEEPWVTSFDVEEGGEEGNEATFEMKKWLSENTDGMFCENYIDQSWDEFCETELEPRGRHVYQFGKKVGERIPKWAVERHASITRK